jgi:xanthine dehydrogenase accessory factor
MLSFWSTALEEFQQGRDFVLASILDVQGSSPRHVGTRFLIRQDGSIVGTIGGGLFEAEVQRFAASALESGTSHRTVFSFKGKDSQSSQMICGGDADVLLEFVAAEDKMMEEIVGSLVTMSTNRTRGYLFTHISMSPGAHIQGSVNHLLVEENGARIGRIPGEDDVLKSIPDPRLLKPSQILKVQGLDHPVFLEWLRPRGTAYIFGGGHVGACVAHLASYVNFRVVVLDDREEFASEERIPDADEAILLKSYQDAFANVTVDEDSYVVIVTRGHSGDRLALTQALKTKARYIGVIGSRRKHEIVFQALLNEGFTQEDFDRVHAPIGVPIGGETPEEIGISIVAQMIQIRNRKDHLKHLGALPTDQSEKMSCGPENK